MADLQAFKFYCRRSHLLTLGWLSVKHLHRELGHGQWEMAAAAPRAAHSSPCLAPASLAERAKAVTTELLPLTACAGPATRKGKWCRVSAQRIAFLGPCCCLWRCTWRWELLPLLLLSPTPMQDLVDEVFFLDVEMSLWQMLQYPEWKYAIWTYRRLAWGMERRNVRWGKANDSLIHISFQVNATWPSDDWAQLHGCVVTLFTSSLSNLLVTSGQVREGESKGTAGTHCYVAEENLWCCTSCWVVKTVNSEINTFVHKAWSC